MKIIQKKNMRKGNRKKTIGEGREQRDHDLAQRDRQRHDRGVEEQPVDADPADPRHAAPSASE
jgi:hypothetical protein